MRTLSFTARSCQGRWHRAAFGLALLSLTALVTAVSAQDDAPEEKKGGPPTAPDPSAEFKKPVVEKLAENRYRLGEIEFNGKTREIRVPSVLNMEEGILEFALVHGSGKLHEALLATEVKPSELQVVLKLCRYRSGEGDVFDMMLRDEDKKGEAGAKERGESATFEVEWKDESGEMRTAPMASWIYNLVEKATMKDGPWVFSGSYVDGNGFVADFDGTHVAIYLYRGAMFNQMRPGADDDERWVAHGDATPPLGTPVTVIIRPVETEGEAG